MKTSQLYIFLSPLLFLFLELRSIFFILFQISYILPIYSCSWPFYFLGFCLFWSILIFPLPLISSLNLFFFILSSPFMFFLLTCVNSNFSCIFRQGWLLFFTKNTYGIVGVSPSSQECQVEERRGFISACHGQPVVSHECLQAVSSVNQYSEHMKSSMLREHGETL